MVQDFYLYWAVISKDSGEVLHIRDGVFSGFDLVDAQRTAIGEIKFNEDLEVIVFDKDKCREI